MRRYLIAGLLVVAAGCDGGGASSSSQVTAEQTIIDQYGGQTLPTCAAASSIAAGRTVRVTELPNLGLALVFVDDEPFCLDSIREVEGVLSIRSGGGNPAGIVGNSAAASGGVDPMPGRATGPHGEPVDPLGRR